mmetsp:Transcript_21841/g.61503  ORF Transcript_21841/g.61503 Transcript_21841/m.61503 type:complete len:247 (-) Transcript_21841:1263-2003(-)
MVAPGRPAGSSSSKVLQKVFSTSPSNARSCLKPFARSPSSSARSARLGSKESPLWTSNFLYATTGSRTSSTTELYTARPTSKPASSYSSRYQSHAALKNTSSCAVLENMPTTGSNNWGTSSWKNSFFRPPASTPCSPTNSIFNSFVRSPSGTDRKKASESSNSEARGTFSTRKGVWFGVKRASMAAWTNDCCCRRRASKASSSRFAEGEQSHVWPDRYQHPSVFTEGAPASCHFRKSMSRPPGPGW